MLKLEREAKTKAIHLKMRDKAKLLSREMRLSLAIALFLHILGLILFSVGPFKFKNANTILPPAFVESWFKPVVDESDSFVYSELEAKHRKRFFPFDLPSEKPSLPNLPEEPIHFPKEYSQSPKPLHSSFESIEDPLAGFSTKGLKTWQKKSPAFQLHISGPLAEKQLSSEIAIADFLAQETIHQTFDVKLDGETGAIFWYRMKEKEAIRPDVKNLLQALRFSTNRGKEIISGTIEISVHL